MLNHQRLGVRNADFRVLGSFHPGFAHRCREDFVELLSILRPRPRVSLCKGFNERSLGWLNRFDVSQRCTASYAAFDCSVVMCGLSMLGLYAYASPHQAIAHCGSSLAACVNAAIAAERSLP